MTWGSSSATTARRSMRLSISPTASPDTARATGYPCSSMRPAIASAVRVALRATADQAAQQAISGHRAVSLDAMSALERKVIHEHLKDRHDIETYSEGQEPSRYLVVAPLVD